jgi:DNA gyrase/topoisomerase IV subunit B
VEVIFTTLHAGGKFGGGGYKVSGGLHGVGSSVVCALSSHLRVQVHRDGEQYEQEFERGEPRRPKITKVNKVWHGTKITYSPDREVFGEQDFDLDLVRARIRAKAYLTPGVTFVLNEKEFCYRGGLADLIASRMVDEQLTPVTEFPLVIAQRTLQVALTWTTDPRTADELVEGFANGIPTPDGGTHILGLKTTVSEVIRDYIRERGLAPKRPQIEAEDVREGLVGAIHVLVENPQFQGQTKDRLNNPEVRAAVSSEVRKALSDWLLRNHAQTQRLVERVVDAARARTASRAAVGEVRRKSVVTKSVLPGKLADCSSEVPELTELFIVEGDSAGGSAKQGRDRKIQAILPVRGKVLNTMEVSWKKLGANQQLADVIDALGCGVGPEFDITRLRYGKVILLMDADSDGHHIAALLLAFFYKAMPGLIHAGKVFLACPPLYRIEVGQETVWARDDTEKAALLAGLPKKLREAAQVSYFKGLGEMPPEMLFSTTMNPRTRQLLRVEIPDGAELATAAMLHDLLGSDVEKRLLHIQNADPRSLSFDS